MGYISVEDVKMIRNALKKEMPQYKFSVVRDHHSSVTISMMKGLRLQSLNTLTVMLVSTRKVLLVRTMGMTRLTLTTLVTFTVKRTLIFDKIVKIAKTAGEKKWYDNSDIMTDYFDTAYYVHLNVGKFGKDYEVVEARNVETDVKVRFLFLCGLVAIAGSVVIVMGSAWSMQTLWKK